MPRQFSLAKLFELLTAAAAVALAIRYYTSSGIRTPPLTSFLGIGLAVWGAFSNWAPVWRVHLIAIGWMVMITGVYQAYFDAYWMCWPVADDIPAIQLWGKTRRDITYLPLTVMIGLLMPAFNGFSKVSKSDRWRLTLAMSLTWFSSFVAANLNAATLEDFEALVNACQHYFNK